MELTYLEALALKILYPEVFETKQMPDEVKEVFLKTIKEEKTYEQ